MSPIVTILYRDIGCCENAPIPDYSGFLGSGKEIEVSSSGQADNMGHKGGSLNELSSSACLSLQLGEQYSCPPYGSLNMPDDKKLEPQMEMNMQVNPAAYQVDSNFGLLRPMYDNGHHDWVSAPGHCGFAIFDETSYHQVGIPFTCSLPVVLILDFFNCTCTSLD